ncbi:ATP-binding protein [Alcaligenes faecalis]|uniref:histidine kinase n=1 Tax=Alcaligenes faecalis TaxID=511 RepID=A0AAE9H9I8_ALCFA|nr:MULTISPECIES: ATP-binding protein [Alcaligenes]MCM2557979.1 ATP-binding protein [Alcaligenes faecalis]MCM2620916.1 ATP-binding protein [Alcaligenes faecalis]MDK7587798.1 ATP-binding protein [Alcaligenes phenolicus]OQV33913.1 two-component sensor histidine kinase [Alcaligenes phenolicus]UPL20126.1 ATP-binding protein [Alcaligenes faecalis]
MSLRLRLLLVIGISLTVLWSAVATWMLMDARHSLREALDSRLAASARMVAGLVAQFPNLQELAQSAERPLDIIARDGVACEISVVRSEVEIQAVSRTAGSPDMSQVALGFGTHVHGGKRWRTFVLREGHIQIAAADSIEIREALVREIMLSAGLPFVVALFGSLLLLWVGIGHGLAPLERIRDMLSRRRPGDDSPLPKVKVPVELQPLLRTLEELLERQQAAIMRERRFTDSAAHELRTPLTGIKTHIQVAHLAAQRPGERNTLDTALSQADQGVQQLQNILQRLLELARLDGQSARMESSQADEAVYAALHALKAIYGDTIDQITLDIRSKPGPVQIEKSLLTVAVQNLIDNALRYTKAQQPISLRIEAGEPGYLRLRVLDHGPGLSDSERDLAMNRFWRGSQQQAGYGLGLSIVNAIATQHGGTLELLNRKSGGLEARLTVPLADQGN